jgi:PPOX class probable F420-dependent enzyme
MEPTPREVAKLFTTFGISAGTSSLRLCPSHRIEAFSNSERNRKTTRSDQAVVKLLRQVLELALVSIMLATGSAVGGDPSPIDLSQFSDASYIYIATVRKDGNQSRAVPVWFVTSGDNQILIDTNSDSWKARRIRRGSPVLVWMGSLTGPALVGKADIVTDPRVQDEMIERIPQKYFLARIGLFGPKRANFESGRIVTIRITPERALLPGFESHPGAPAPSVSDK